MTRSERSIVFLLTANVLFIIDTSLSMNTTVATTDPYDSSVSYAGSCDSNAIYWSEVDVVPDCSLSNNFIDKSSFYCAAAEAQLDAIGSYTNTMVRWQTLAPGFDTAPVECQADSGIHGDGRNAHLWAAGGTDLSDPFTKKPEEELSWGSAPRNVGYSVYDGNYLNWKAGANDTTRSIRSCWSGSRRSPRRFTHPRSIGAAMKPTSAIGSAASRPTRLRCRHPHRRCICSPRSTPAPRTTPC